MALSSPVTTAELVAPRNNTECVKTLQWWWEFLIKKLFHYFKKTYTDGLPTSHNILKLKCEFLCTY